MFVDSDRKSVFSFFLVTRESTPEGNRTPIKSLGNFYSIR